MNAADVAIPVGTEPDPEDFEEAGESTSSISVYARYCTGATRLNWFHGVWNQMDWPEVDGEPLESADPPFHRVLEEGGAKRQPDSRVPFRGSARYRAALLFGRFRL